MERLDEINEVLNAETKIIRRVIEIIRSQKRVKSKKKSLLTLRHSLEKVIREEFEFKEEKCSTCGEWGPSKNFFKDKNKLRGRRGVCRFCDKLKKLDQYWECPEHKRALRVKSYYKVKLRKDLNGNSRSN